MRRKIPMKTRILAISIAIVLLAIGSAQVRADQAGDDLVLCCQLRLEAAATPLISALPTFNPQFTDCVALDGSVKSMNSCKGLLVGCTERAFACQPAEDGTRGAKDCFCAQRKPRVLNQLNAQ
jgi:hypothetical protein